MNWLALAIAVKGPWRTDKLLNQLQAAGFPASTEIHIACDQEHSPAAASHGFIVHGSAGKSLFELWAIAINASQSPWVAIFHVDALPAPGWFKAIEDATEGFCGQGLWGPVEPGIGPFDRRMVGYLTEYVQFHRPVHPAMAEVPGSNLVLRRALVECGTDFSKTRLIRQGLIPSRVDGAVALYERPIRFPVYCRRRFRHARAYAANRTPRLPLFVALPMILTLPGVRTLRILRHALQHKHLRLSSMVWLPRIVIAETCWSAGEMVGYLTRREGKRAHID